MLEVFNVSESQSYIAIIESDEKGRTKELSVYKLQECSDFTGLPDLSDWGDRLNLNRKEKERLEYVIDKAVKNKM